MLTRMQTKCYDKIMGRWTESGTKREAIKLLMANEPHLTPREVAKRLDTTRWYVYKVMQKDDLECSPLNRRILRLEEKIKFLEKNMLRVLEARGLAAHRGEFGL